MTEAETEQPQPSPSAKNARWGQERRLEFIDFRLLWEGRINRGELVDFFKISIQQASLDLALYSAMAPGNLNYDRSEKAYFASAAFAPVLTSRDAQVYLNQLFGVTTDLLPNATSFLGWKPACDVVQFPVRRLEPEVLLKILHAVRTTEQIEVSYQSMRRPEATNRWIAPHAFAFDGSRWHTRAWCFENNEFRDFVLTRIRNVHQAKKSDIDPSTDTRWDNVATVVLRPRSDLSADQRQAVANEFGMQDGVLRVSVREALVYYFVRQLQLDANGHSLVRSYPIECVNLDELMPLIKEAAR